MTRQLSQAARLYVWLRDTLPGEPISLARMVEVAGTTEQAVRNMLCQIRNGRVPHPEQRGKRLPPLPIYYHRKSGVYYLTDKTTSGNVEEGVPQQTYGELCQNILTRVRNLRDSFVEGLGVSIERSLVSDPAVRQLLQEIGEKRLWQLNDDILLLLKAYGEMRDQLLEPGASQAVASPRRGGADQEVLQEGGRD